MQESQKLENLLNLALDATQEERSRSQILESLRISKEYMEQFMKPSC